MAKTSLLNVATVLLVPVHRRQACPSAGEEVGRSRGYLYANRHRAGVAGHGQRSTPAAYGVTGCRSSGDWRNFRHAEVGAIYAVQGTVCHGRNMRV